MSESKPSLGEIYSDAKNIRGYLNVLMTDMENLKRKLRRSEIDVDLGFELNGPINKLEECDMWYDKFMASLARNAPTPTSNPWSASELHYIHQTRALDFVKAHRPDVLLDAYSFEAPK